MSISGFFESFGAPLNNVRWSWGAVRSDGTVFLRVWQDQTRTDNGCRYVRVARQASEYNPVKLGYQERLNHITLVQQGAACYMIMCEARDVEVSPREIQSFNENELSVGGKIIDLDNDGCAWIEITG